MKIPKEAIYSFTFTLAFFGGLYGAHYYFAGADIKASLWLGLSILIAFGVGHSQFRQDHNNDNI